MAVVSREEYLIALRVDLAGFQRDLATAGAVVSQWAATSGARVRQASDPFATLQKTVMAMAGGYDKLSMTANKATGVMTVGLGKTAKAATKTGGVFRRFWTSMKTDMGNFTNIFARRLSFTFATTIERMFINVLRAPKEFLGEVVQVGAEFEDAMLRTAAVASGGLEGIGRNFDDLSIKAREMGRTTTFTSTEVANAMYEMVSSGLSVAETWVTIGAVVNFAGATMSSLGVSVDVLTQIMKSWNLPASEMGDIADVLVEAINNTTLNVDRLRNALKFAAPAAAAFDQSLEDTIAVVSFFVDVTKQGGISGRAFRQALVRLASSTKKTRDVISTLNSTLDGSRITLEQLDPRTTGVIELFTTLANSTLSAAEAMTIFGARSGPVVYLAIDRIREAALAGAAGLDELRDKLEMAKVLDVSRKQFEFFMTSVKSGFLLLKSAATEFMLTIFDYVRPGVIMMQKLGMKFLGSLRDNVDLLVSSVRVLITAVGVLMGAAALTLLFKGLVIVVENLRIAFLDLTFFSEALAVVWTYLGRWDIAYILIDALMRIGSEFDVLGRLTRALTSDTEELAEESVRSGKEFKKMQAFSDMIIIGYMWWTIVIQNLVLGFKQLQLAAINAQLAFWGPDAYGIRTQAVADHYTSLQKEIQALKDSRDAIRDNMNERAGSLGMVDTATDSVIRMSDALRSQLEVLAASLGMERQLAEALAQTSLEAITFTQGLLNRIVGLDKEITILKEGEGAWIRQQAAIDWANPREISSKKSWKMSVEPVTSSLIRSANRVASPPRPKILSPSSSRKASSLDSSGESSRDPASSLNSSISSATWNASSSRRAISRAPPNRRTRSFVNSQASPRA